MEVVDRESANTDTESIPIIGGHLVDRKTVDTHRAEFACKGYELHVIRKRGGMAYFEVRRWNQARVCITLHDLQAFLTQIGGAT